MSSFPKPDARVKAVVASLATVAALVTLVVWRPAGILSVVLALICVLLGMVAGVTVTAARQAPRQPRGDTPSEDWPVPGGYGVDADTLEALDPRAVRAVREHRTADGYAVDADTLEALDPRAVREHRTVNRLSDR
ncbi:hypothetical protein ONA91_01645 [Micromonospora sp. DR5-3]|uniref:hypothetical protein n=1 Tax=unclassified Micromonospora TaxID=2617518 RepID=UPI0011D79DE0|nr:MULTISPECIES: hypothetical protein [unclassified Micromonospora]MCW3813163.1 hypothetical protein [Micromonospora sp. DR5-3]TYC25859.1 hypothetical protein FXF52_00325 [Micromonospora sp. MP36]